MLGIKHPIKYLFFDSRMDQSSKPIKEPQLTFASKKVLSGWRMILLHPPLPGNKKLDRLDETRPITELAVL